MNTEEMKQQQDILLSAVAGLAEKNGGWRGTPSELQKTLNLAPNPQALAVQVSKLSVELEKRGISLRPRIARGRLIIKIFANSQKEEKNPNE